MMLMHRFKNKNLWLGRRYEGYIAWLLKSQGWDVEQRGKYGKFDRGIDLTATKDGRTRYIQCKKRKSIFNIRENVVSQFYGSVVAVVGQKDIDKVELYIYSTVKPSAYALDEAEKLNIKFEQIRFPFFRNAKAISAT